MESILGSHPDQLIVTLPIVLQIECLSSCPLMIDDRGEGLGADVDPIWLSFEEFPSSCTMTPGPQTLRLHLLVL